MFKESKQILLRGSRLRNTRWVVAVVLYTGHETTQLMNFKAASFKRYTFTLCSVAFLYNVLYYLT